MIDEDKKRALDNAFEAGKAAERERILADMQSYFELTRFSEEHEGAKPNPEWDAGFQAAMTFIKEQNPKPKCACDECEIPATKDSEYCFDCKGECDDEGYLECTCDPCGDKDCACYGQKCDFCKAKDA